MGRNELDCPICGHPVPASEPPVPPFPFCSDRCRLIDVGRWLDGRYGIVADPDPAEAGGESTEDRPEHFK
jgi:hypothetical protein